MLSITIGPLAFPLAPLLLLASLFLAGWLARRLAPPPLGSDAETALWLATGLGLVAARAAHVLRHAQAYAESPWAVLDVRDGGWVAGPGLAVAAVVLLWRADRLPKARRSLGIAAGSGVALWAAMNGALLLGQPDADLRALPAVVLRPLPQATAATPVEPRPLQALHYLQDWLARHPKYRDVRSPNESFKISTQNLLQNASNFQLFVQTFFRFHCVSV